jgi:hypothetical protein
MSPEGIEETVNAARKMSRCGSSSKILMETSFSRQVHRKRGSQHDVSGCGAERIRLRSRRRSARHTTADRMAAHRKLDPLRQVVAEWDLQSILANVGGGGVGGAILMVVVGIIKNQNVEARQLSCSAAKALIGEKAG